MAAAMANGVGGDGSARLWGGERDRGGDEDERRARGTRMMHGVVQTRRGSGGKQEVAGRVLARGGHKRAVLLAGGRWSLAEASGLGLCWAAR